MEYAGKYTRMKNNMISNPGEIVIDKFQFYDNIGGYSRWKLIRVNRENDNPLFRITCSDHEWRTFYSLELATKKFISLKQAFSKKIG